MNKEEPYRDQAERLKQRIEKINENTEESDRASTKRTSASAKEE